MPLPPELDKNIRKSFEELIAVGNCIVADLTSQNEKYVSDSHTSNYTALKINSSSIVRMVLGTTARGNEFQSQIEELQWTPHDVRILVGILTALQADYLNGYHLDLEEAILANLSTDYLYLAEALLDEGIEGRYDHVPAAVLCGAVLENRLRSYCEKLDPTIETIRPNGKSITLGALISELDKVKAFDTQTRNFLKGWANIRNAAAHGRFDEFKREQVEFMLLGVKGFLANHL